MKCDEAQKRMLDGSLDEAVRSHLSECRECAGFANFANEALRLAAGRMEKEFPPDSLDIAVKAYARRKRACASFTPALFFWRKPFIALAAAASLMIMSAILFFLSRPDDNIPAPERIATIRDRKNIAEINAAMQWDKIDLEDEYFNLSANLALCKELINYSALEEDKNIAEDYPEIEIPTEILI